MSRPLRLITVAYALSLVVAFAMEAWHRRGTLLEFAGMPTPVPEEIRAAATATARAAAAVATARQEEEMRAAESRRDVTAKALRQENETQRRKAGEEARRAEEKQRLALAAQRRQEEQEATERRRRTFFRQDFSNVPLGEVPHGWIGAENLVCKVVGARKQRVLTTFQPGPLKLRIPDVKFPDNFRLQWIISGDSECLHAPHAYVVLAGLQAGIKQSFCNEYWAYLGNSQVKLGQSIVTSSPMELALEKQGAIFRLLIDGREVLVARDPAHEHIDGGFNLVLGAEQDTGYQTHVSLHLLEGIDLGSSSGTPVAAADTSSE